MLPEHGTSATYTAPSDTASPGFHLPDTLDWSSLLAQVKNRVIVMPRMVPRSPNDAPAQEDNTDDSRRRAVDAEATSANPTARLVVSQSVRQPNKA